MKLLFQVEFSSNPVKFLHQNKGEDGLTLGGVYEKYNKDNIDWKYVKSTLDKHGGSFKAASVELFEDSYILGQVYKVFKEKYWDTLSLDKIVSQKIADEMFLFGVVAHPRNAAKLAQRVVGVVDDGIIGPGTIKALNSFNEAVFDVEFDKAEKKYFQGVVDRNPKLAINLAGWKNRADFV